MGSWLSALFGLNTISAETKIKKKPPTRTSIFNVPNNGRKLYPIPTGYLNHYNYENGWNHKLPKLSIELTAPSKKPRRRVLH